MSENVAIRKTKMGDEKILAHIQTEAWKNAFADILPPEELLRYTDISKVEEMYRWLLEEGRANGLLLSVDNKPHCIAYWDKAREEEAADCAELICIHSLPDNWGRGYGSVMMEQILKNVKEAGYNHIILWVFEKNTRARRFYERHGFVASARTKDTFGAAEVLYVKEL